MAWRRKQGDGRERRGGGVERCKEVGMRREQRGRTEGGSVGGRNYGQEVGEKTMTGMRGNGFLNGENEEK